MPITSDLVLEADEAFARIPITIDRAKELETELAQFAEAAETARRRLVFAAEPADFIITLHRLAETKHA